jgi:hypothetical protein
MFGLDILDVEDIKNMFKGAIMALVILMMVRESL